MENGKRWTVRDRQNNEIYLTQERWEHLIDPDNHPELAEHEEQLKETVRSGKREQDDLNPRKYRYSKEFNDLPLDNTHIVAIVLFAFVEIEDGQIEPNNYITTAFMKEIG